MTQPGARLRSFAQHLFTASTMEQLIDPAIADLQHEHDEARRHGRVWRGRVMWLVGHCACWKVLTIAVVRHAVLERTAEDDRAVGRAIGFSFVAVLALTALLLLPVLQMRALRDSGTGTASWLVLYSVPSALVVALPLGLLFGIVLGLRNRVSTTRVKWTVAAFGTLCSAAAFIIIGWSMPAANQAFRELAAGQRLLRGFNELTLGELASGDAARLVWVTPGGVTAERLAWEFHFRVALAFAPLALALFSLGATTARRRVHGPTATALAAFTVCLGYYALLYGARRAMFSRDWLPSVATAWIQWMPNLTFLVIALLWFHWPLSARPKESPE